MSIVVVGTDTGVGKTVVSALIVLRYAHLAPLAYWKPVATGASRDRDRDRVLKWLGGEADVLDEVYLWDDPVAPHLAARRAGDRLDPERVLEALVAHGLEDAERSLVIEGIGGLLVPLTERGDLLIDLVREMHLPALLVARSGLGTINHTLLSLEALRRREVPLAGVVLSGPPDRENRRAIERFGRCEVVGEVGPIARLDAAGMRAAARRFDPEGRLQEYFR